MKTKILKKLSIRYKKLNINDTSKTSTPVEKNWVLRPKKKIWCFCTFGGKNFETKNFQKNNYQIRDIE